MTTTNTLTSAVEETAALLLAAVHRDGTSITGDMRVAEIDAAKLLGYAPGYMKSMRQEGKGPVSYQRGVYGGRVSYRIMDLAVWIESAREQRFLLNDR